MPPHPTTPTRKGPLILIPPAVPPRASTAAAPRPQHTRPPQQVRKDPEAAATPGRRLDASAELGSAVKKCTGERHD
jgi:hypothetical protein